MYNKWIPLSKTIDITITAIIIKSTPNLYSFNFFSFLEIKKYKPIPITAKNPTNTNDFTK